MSFTEGPKHCLQEKVLRFSVHSHSPMQTQPYPHCKQHRAQTPSAGVILTGPSIQGRREGAQFSVLGRILRGLLSSPLTSNTVKYWNMSGPLCRLFGDLGMSLVEENR